MKVLGRLTSALGIALVALAASGCADEGPTCGEGTTNTNGTCVATVHCGDGTTLQGDECVPDGSLICTQGTRFDAATGQCVVDPSACAEGTVLIGGACVPEDDTLSADHDEAAEPNDMTAAGGFGVPALDQMTTIHGCITPVDGKADVDAWILTASGPALLEITADGVGGLAAAFQVQGNGIAALPNYLRFGLNLTGDTSKRQVYLPVAGEYQLRLDDSRAILLGGAAGSANTCYYATIKQVALPAAVTPTLPATTGTDAGNVAIYGYTPGAVGDIYDTFMSTESASLRPAFVVRKNNEFVADASTVIDEVTGTETPPMYTLGGLEATDWIDLIVDNVYNFALAPQPYALTLFDIPAVALPTDGTAITHTKHNNRTAGASYVDNNYAYFDVSAGDVLHVDLTSSVPVSMTIFRRDIFTPAGDPDIFVGIATSTTPRGAFRNQLIRFRTAGRYYLVTRDPAGTRDQTYMITSRIVRHTPTALTYGTASTAQPLSAANLGFHTLDLTSVNWLELAVTGSANWGDGNQARITLYDLGGEGWMGPGTGTNYPALQAAALQPVNGSAPVGRVTAGDTRDFLVRIENSGTPGTAPTYDLVARERAHIALGTPTAGAATTRIGMDTVAAGGKLRYLAFGTAGNAASTLTTPTGNVDLRLTRLNVDETPADSVNDTGVATAEALDGAFAGTPAWFAFAVENLTVDTTSNVDLSFEVLLPRPYVAGNGALAFVDACTGGTMLPDPLDGAGDDEFSAVQTLPRGFRFRFFNEPVSQLVIGSNGLMSFGATPPTCGSAACYSNVTIPTTAAPNGIIAAYWDDLVDVTVCRKDEPNAVTIQWTGNLYGGDNEAVEVQVVLNRSGKIDLIYGPNHAANGESGNGATVGIESATAMLHNLVAFDAAMIAPSTSHSFTPQQ